MKVSNEAGMTIQSFKIGVPDAALCDLKQRLAHTRWPDTIPGSGWSYGMDLDYMRQLRDYWMNGFDWRACEAEWNRLPHFLFEADGTEIHFIHARGQVREEVRRRCPSSSPTAGRDRFSRC